MVMVMVFLLLAWIKHGRDRQAVLGLATICTFASGICLVLHVAVSRRLYRTSSRRKKPEADRKGAVLVLVLVLTAVIGALVLQVQWRARSALARASAQFRHTRLELAATDVARQALQRLADDQDLAVDHLDEPWAALNEVSRPSGVQCTVQVRDEQGFFNLNNLGIRAAQGQRSPGAVLLDIFVACGIARPLDKVAALEDWVEGRGRPARETLPGSDPAGVASRRPLFSWGELVQVKGLNRAMFERRERSPLLDPLRGDLVDAVTVLPPMAARLTPLNVNTASRDALRGILGVEYSGRVERLLRERASRPLRNLGDLGLDPALLASVQAYLEVRSSYFSVTATAEQDDDAAEVRALAVRDNQGEVRLLHWVSR